MRIGLWNLESKVENTAMMQVSQYHKQQGDHVELYSPLFRYDKVYVFSLFSFTKKPLLRTNMVAGGTGFNICSQLPPEIETSELDYSIYPNCRTSYIWFSRGCIRSCPFCIVPVKEGKIHTVKPKNLNPKGKTISVMDNSFTANPDFKAAVSWLAERGQSVNFQCGLDVRLNHFEQWCEIKNRLKIYKQIRTAWDNPKDNLELNLKLMANVFGKSRIMVYVLIGYWSTPEQDLYRVMKIRELGLDAWVMPYNKKDAYQKAFERWCNRHVGCSWHEYSHGSWKPKIMLFTSEKKESAKPC
jgi:hypothetical protein